MNKQNFLLFLVAGFSLNLIAENPDRDSEGAPQSTQTQLLQEIEQPLTDRQKHFEDLKQHARECDQEKFFERLGGLGDFSRQELFELVSFIKTQACNGEDCKQVQDMMDYFIIAASGDAYQRQPKLREAVEAMIFLGGFLKNHPAYR